MNTVYQFCVYLYMITVCVNGLAHPQDPRDLFPENIAGEGPYRSLFAEENTDFIDKTVQQMILIPGFVTRSMAECSMMCLRYFCQGFFFNSLELMCTLTHFRYYNLTIARTKIGSSYYLTFYESCPSDQGYVYYPSENFCVKLNTTQVIYPETQYYCVLERASIVRVDSVKKFNILQNLLVNQGYNQANDFAYIMSQPISLSNNYAFIDGTVMPYYNWMSGKPDSNGQRIAIGGTTQQFDDVNEMELHGFICEKYIYKN